MSKNENKTRPTSADVIKYIEAIADEQRRQDAQALIEIFSGATGQSPTMWGTSIVGFGSYHYKYESGREGDYLRVGFAARKNDLTLYGLHLDDEASSNSKLLPSLGKHKRGKGCLYIGKLADVDRSVLEKMIKSGYTSKQFGEV